MIDEKIVDMYWARSEDAILETSKKYGKLCHSIAYNILRNNEDAQECVNDTYLSAWNSMPSQRPNKLLAFLGKITRNIALNKYRHNSTKSRSNGQINLVLEELADCVSGNDCTKEVIDKIIFEDILNHFLDKLSQENRDIFVSRYWYFYSTAEIARLYQISESKVRVSLHRMRNSLRLILEKEGVY